MNYLRHARAKEITWALQWDSSCATSTLKEREGTNSFPEPNRNNTCFFRERTCRNANMFGYLGWIWRSWWKYIELLLTASWIKHNDHDETHQHPNSSLIFLCKHPFLTSSEIQPGCTKPSAKELKEKHWHTSNNFQFWWKNSFMGTDWYYSTFHQCNLFLTKPVSQWQSQKTNFEFES